MEDHTGAGWKWSLQVCPGLPILFFNVFLTVLDSIESVGNPGQVLDIKESRTADDSPVLTWNRTKNNNQQFFLRMA